MFAVLGGGETGMSLTQLRPLGITGLKADLSSHPDALQYLGCQVGGAASCWFYVLQQVPGWMVLPSCKLICSSNPRPGKPRLAEGFPGGLSLPILSLYLKCQWEEGSRRQQREGPDVQPSFLFPAEGVGRRMVPNCLH